MSDPVMRLVALIKERADDCADRALRQVRESAPMANQPTSPRFEKDVRLAVEISLELLAERREPSTTELAACRDIGQRAARQGVSSDDLTRTLHVVHLVLWELLRELAKELPDDVAQGLVHRTADIWTAFDQMSSATAEGHRIALARLDLDQRQRALAWLKALRQADDDAAQELARSFDLAPHGRFVAAVHGGPHEDLPDAGDVIVIEQADHTVVFMQPDGEAVGKAEDFMAALLRDRELTPAGVGLERHGMPGARQSLEDALLSYRASRETGAHLLSFRESWLTALAVEHREEHEAFMCEAVAAVEADERVAQTLVTFLETGGNLSSVGKKLGVHPNTVAYRLRQFSERTGIDPRSASGRAIVQIAVALAGTAGEGQPAVGKTQAAGRRAG